MSWSSIKNAHCLSSAFSDLQLSPISSALSQLIQYQSLRCSKSQKAGYYDHNQYTGIGCLGLKRNESLNLKFQGPVITQKKKIL